MFRDQQAHARVMRADRTLGQLLARIAKEIDDSALISDELADIGQILNDLASVAFDKADSIDQGMAQLIGSAP